MTGSYLDWGLGENSTYYNPGTISVLLDWDGNTENPRHRSVQFKSEIDVYYACRAMESVCRQKDLVLRLVDLNDSHEAVPEERVLQACTSLRCRYVGIVDLSKSFLRSPVAGRILVSIERDNPYFDLLDMYDCFRGALFSE